MTTAFELVDPTITVTATDHHVPAPRRASLAGARVGLLANGKTHGDTILTLLAEALRARWDLTTGSIVTKPHPSAPPTAEQLAALTTSSDVVITAVGDCGSCSSCSVVDAIRLEKQGIPVVAVVTEPFLPTVQAIAALNGAPDFEVATVPHPVTSRTADELRALVPGLLAQLETILMQIPAEADGQAGQAPRPSALTTEVVDGALAPLRDGLATDGVTLRLLSIDEDNLLRFELSVRDASCRECMLPVPHLERILAAALERTVSSEVGVQIVEL